MPCAITSGRPTDLANGSFQWIGLKSPDAPAYLIRSRRSTLYVLAGSSWPTSTSSYFTVAVISGTSLDDDVVGRADVLAVDRLDHRLEVEALVAADGADAGDRRLGG